MKVVSEGDPWTMEDAKVALKLLKRLQAEGELKRAALQNSGSPSDKDAWLWGDVAPDLGEQLQRACEDEGRDGGDRQQCEGVATRLLRPVDVGGGRHVALHVPLVQEKLGCLIPADLHPRLDGKEPKQNPGAVAAASAVELCCGSCGSSCCFLLCLKWLWGRRSRYSSRHDFG